MLTWHRPCLQYSRQKSRGHGRRRGSLTVGQHLEEERQKLEPWNPIRLKEKEVQLFELSQNQDQLARLPRCVKDRAGYMQETGCLTEDMPCV